MASSSAPPWRSFWQQPVPSPSSVPRRAQPTPWRAAQAHRRHHRRSGRGGDHPADARARHRRGGRLPAQPRPRCGRVDRIRAAAQSATATPRPDTDAPLRGTSTDRARSRPKQRLSAPCCHLQRALATNNSSSPTPATSTHLRWHAVPELELRRPTTDQRAPCSLETATARRTGRPASRLARAIDPPSAKRCRSPLLHERGPLYTGADITDRTCSSRSIGPANPHRRNNAITTGTVKSLSPRTPTTVRSTSASTIRPVMTLQVASDRFCPRRHRRGGRQHFGNHRRRPHHHLFGGHASITGGAGNSFTLTPTPRPPLPRELRGSRRDESGHDTSDNSRHRAAADGVVVGDCGGARR